MEQQQAQATMTQAPVMVLEGQPVVANGELVPLSREMLPASRAEEFRAMAQAVNFRDTTSVISYGGNLRNNFGKLTEDLLSHSRTTDMDELGDLIVNMATKLKEIDANSLDRASQPWWSRAFFDVKDAVEKFLIQIDTVDQAVKRMLRSLDGENKTQLIRNIALLDAVYAEAVRFYVDLSAAIEIGRERVAEERQRLEGLRAQAESGDLLAMQELADQQRALDLFETRLSDFDSARTAVMTFFPQVRMLQAAKLAVLSKVDTGVMVLVPLWRINMVGVLAGAKLETTTAKLTTVTQATGEMLEKASIANRRAVKKAQEAVEAPIIPFEKLKATHAQTIGALEDVTQAIVDGRQRRANYEVEYQKMDAAMRAALLTSAQRIAAVPTPKEVEQK